MRPDELSSDTGRNAWKEPTEVGEGLYINRRPFWASEVEEMRWLYAVESNRPHPSFLAWKPVQEHLNRICAKAGQPVTEEPGKSMPEIPVEG